MSKIILYPHGGSGNHGCEALVRATIKILGDNNDIYLASKSPEQDIRYGLEKICTIVPQNSDSPSLIKRLWTSVKYRILGDKLAYERNTYRDILRHVDSNTICLSFGGDNYCYGKPTYIYIMNRLFRERGAKTILWGCSIEPSNIDTEMIDDLRGYNLIIVREPETYNALIQRGITNVKMAPDPAFALDSDNSIKLPAGFIPGNTVGLNLSPMALSYSADNATVLENYIKLIANISGSTDMNIALIPHVAWSDNDDREPLTQLFEKYHHTGRISMVYDCNCEQLKYLISQCRFIVTARTHASIAAYSTGVPTLVLGYSIKAKGIAVDLFGTHDDFVVPVQNLTSEDDLLNAFIKIQNQEIDIIKILKSKSNGLKLGALAMKNLI